MSLDPSATHYDAGGIETLAIIRAKLTREQYRGFLMGNALKYMCRANHKGSGKWDTEKARNYIQWLLDDLNDQPS